jgi:uncharacterized membrane protein
MTDFWYGDGPRNRQLRVGDKEREAVGEILRQRHLEGRLDVDEFQTRIERCLAAKTYADLDVLLVDFPPDEQTRRRHGWSPWPFPVVLVPIALAVALVGGFHAAWLVVPLVFFFVVRPMLWRSSPLRACGPRRTTRVY